MTDDIFSTRARTREKGLLSRTPGRRSRPRRVKFVPQVTSSDCGAACVAMVLASYGRHVPLKELHGDIAELSDPLTASALKRVAEKHGMSVRGLSLEAEDLEQLQMPAILHWEFKHFVVVERCSARGAIILDPTSSRRRISFEQLAESFTGVALELIPSLTFERRSGGRPAIREILQAGRRGVGALVSLSFALQLLSMATPAMTLFLLDRVIPQHKAPALPIVFAGVAMFAFLYYGLAFSRMRLSAQLQVRFDQDLTRGVTRRLFRLPLRFFQQRGTGEILNRLGSIVQIREILAQHAISVALDGIAALLYLVVLAITAPHLITVAVAVALLQGILALIAAPHVREAVYQQIAAQARSQTYLVEVVREIQSVKVGGAEDNVFDAYRELHARETRATARRLEVVGLSDTLNGALVAVAPLLLLAFGARDVLSRTLSIGTMLAANVAAIGFLLPWNSFVTSAQRIAVIWRHALRIQDILDEPPEHTGTKRAPARITTGVVFDNVTFAYGEGRASVHDISFSLAPGELVAVVGRSGAGKSTLAKLAIGLYPCDGIFIDGAPLADYDLPDFRRSVGVVLQESAVFADTIRNNISFNNPTLPLSDLQTAARLACIADDIERLPLGYETVVSELGSNFSGGQRQRICIARAVAHRPSMMILDEATSELDTETEQRIYDNLRALGVPLLVIAHRLSTIQTADRIVVMDGGRIVESGTHESLMRSGGHYFRLRSIQQMGTTA